MSTSGRSVSRLALICVASLGWALGFGIGAPLSSLWLKQAGLSAWVVGLNTSIYYLGVAVAAPLLPLLMRRHNRTCILAGIVLDGITTALFPLVHGQFYWHLLRLVGGIGTALSLIPMETLVNQNAPPDRRSRDFGVYAFCVALGIGLGSLVGLPLYPLAPRLAFALGGLVTLVAAVPIWLGAPRHCHSEEASSSAGQVSLPWRTGLIGLGTAWVQGFLEGGTLTFLSIYLLGLGYTEAGVSGIMGGLFAGVVLAQLPLAFLADRLGRLRVLLLCHALLLLGSLIVPFTSWTSPLVFWLFVLGACSGALYPLGLALLGERVPKSALARANAWYLACNCCGSLTGPVLIGLAIDAFGLPAQFALSGAAVAVVVLAWLFAELFPARPGKQSGVVAPQRKAA